MTETDILKVECQIAHLKCIIFHVVNAVKYGGTLINLEVHVHSVIVISLHV